MMAGATEAEKKLATAKYVLKVCGYLGVVDRRKCVAAFNKLYDNMKTVLEAITPPPREWSESEIVVLMAGEVAKNVCRGVRAKALCMEVLHRALARGEGLERLSELSEEDRWKISRRLMKLVASLSKLP